MRLAARLAPARRIEEAVDRFASMVDDFKAQRTDLLKSSEETLVRLAVTVAKKIVGDAVEVQPEVVLETVRRALRHVQEKENLVQTMVLQGTFILSFMSNRIVTSGVGIMISCSRNSHPYTYLGSERSCLKCNCISGTQFGEVHLLQMGISKRALTSRGH